MVTTLVVGVLSVFFAFLARYKETKFGLAISFVIIFLFLGLRFNFGSDYRGYLDGFSVVNSYSLLDYFLYDGQYEAGWVILCKIFYPFGFFSMVISLAVFNCLVYYYIIKKYVPKDYYWVAVFLYAFSPMLMLVHSSAMRQSISIAIFLLSLDFLYEKKAIKYFACVGCAMLFHTSAIILAPIYMLRSLNWKLNLTIGLCFLSVLIILLMTGRLSEIIFEFTLNNFQRYSFYDESAEFGTGLGTIIQIGQLIMVVYFVKYQNNKNALIFKLSLIQFAFIPIAFFVSMIMRLAMYFEPLFIIVIAIIISNISSSVIRYGFITLFIFITFYSLFPFFNSPIWEFANYQTIFSSTKFY